MHKFILKHGYLKKMLGPVGIPSAPSYKLSLGKQVLPGGIYLSLPPTRLNLTFLKVGVLGEQCGRTGAKTHTLLGYAGHWLTRCNVS